MTKDDEKRKVKSMEDVPLSMIPPINDSGYAHKKDHSGEPENPMPQGAPINNDPDRYNPNPKEAPTLSAKDAEDEPLSMIPPINDSGYAHKKDHSGEPENPMPQGAPINNDPDRYNPNPKEAPTLSAKDAKDEPLSMIPPINDSEYVPKKDRSGEPENPMPQGAPINNDPDKY